MSPAIIYLPDENVDTGMDAEIRDLLTICFTKPQDVVFRERRYFREPYRNRWIIRSGQGVLVAHAGVHEKHVQSAGVEYRIGGICEVCVHPAYRGRGYVRLMLGVIHDWLSVQAFVFAVLFGNPQVYGSSGYRPVDNLLHGDEQTGWMPVKALEHELSLTPWPAAAVYLPGPRF
jgi:GNAT superfamily N-acetyltransferase